MLQRGHFIPPSVIIAREEIVRAAAKAIGCSTQPVLCAVMAVFLFLRRCRR